MACARPPTLTPTETRSGSARSHTDRERGLRRTWTPASISAMVCGCASWPPPCRRAGRGPGGHPASPAMGESRRVSASVVIAGGGPVGFGLAVTLGTAGVSPVLVERQLKPSAIPRGLPVVLRAGGPGRDVVLPLELDRQDELAHSGPALEHPVSLG